MGEDENWNLQTQLDNPERFGDQSARGAQWKKERRRQLSTGM